MSESKAGSALTSVIFGGGTFALFFFLLTPANPVVSGFAAAGAVLLGGLLSTRKSNRASPKKLAAAGVSPEDMKAAMALGYGKLRILRNAADKMSDPQVRRKAASVCEVVEKILKNIQRDPRDLRPSRQFLNYYLDSAINIFKQYLELSAHGIRNAEIQTTLNKVEDTIGSMRAAFENHYAKLLENDVLHLDTELDVLRKTFEMEGLGKPGSAAFADKKPGSSGTSSGSGTAETETPPKSPGLSIDEELEALKQRVRENKL